MVPGAPGAPPLAIKVVVIMAVGLVVAVIGALILAALWYDIARLITPGESRPPPLARLRGRKVALDDAERWCVGLRLHGRIDATDYQRRMSTLARGRRTFPPGSIRPLLE